MAAAISNKMGVLVVQGGTRFSFLRHRPAASNLFSLPLAKTTAPPREHLSQVGGRFFSTGHGLGENKPNFGILFDIDGVIVRGRTVLPSAPEAFQKLVNPETLEFEVPCVFVTNAGNSLRQEKADKLSEWLGIPVTEDQVVMAHSPLKMYTEFHDLHVLVSGQGPVEYIANSLGFTNVTTMDQLRHAYPALDAVDHKRRRAAPCGFEKYFPKIDAVVLFGEPVRWETSLQLLIDVIISNGQPSSAPQGVPKTNIPILACNMDLQWMAEAVMPRFGHGAFLHCLETLYKKITSNELAYTGMIGKPSEITYRHSEHVLQQEAAKLGLGPVSTLYCIGDNICTDIFGANLYNDYLANRNGDTNITKQVRSSRCIENLVGVPSLLNGANQCHSILVETGVYSRFGGSPVSLEHCPKDFLPVEEKYQEPTFAVDNVLGAVDTIFQAEQYKQNNRLQKKCEQ